MVQLHFVVSMCNFLLNLLSKPSEIKMGSYSPTFEILYSKLLNDELVEGLLSIVGHIYPSLYTRTRRIERWSFFGY